jgi:hypothetical protein
MPSLFHIDLGLIDEYDGFLSDVLKWTSILFTLHLFKVIGGSARFFNGEFIQNCLIATTGLALYHLVIKKTVRFVYNENEEGFSGTVRLFVPKSKKKKPTQKNKRLKKLSS